MSERRACAATIETADVIATCLEEPGHSGPHLDYGNGVKWTALTPAPAPDDAEGKG